MACFTHPNFSHASEAESRQNSGVLDVRHHRPEVLRTAPGADEQRKVSADRLVLASILLFILAEKVARVRLTVNETQTCKLL
jgi:hypothetical protein